MVSREVSTLLQIKKKQIMVSETSKVLREINRDNIPCALFGSMGVIAFSGSFYKVPNDIDIIVSAGFAKRIKIIMRKLGYDYKPGFHGPHYAEFKKQVNGALSIVHIVYGYTIPFKDQESVNKELWKFRYDFKMALDHRKIIDFEKNRWYVVPKEELVITTMFKQESVKRVLDLAALLPPFLDGSLNGKYLRERVDSDKRVSAIIIARLSEVAEASHSSLNLCRQLSRALTE